MRVFWAFIAVLVLIGAGIPLVSGIASRLRTSAERAAAERALMAERTARSTVRPDSGARPQAADTGAATPAPGAAAEPEAAANPEAVTPPEPSPTPPDPQPETRQTEPTTPAPAPSDDAGSDPSPQPPSDAQDADAARVAPQPTPEPGAPTAAATAPAENAEASGAPPPAPANAPAPQAAADAPAPGPKIVTRDDGSMLVDDRFVVKGKGTADAPYEVTWEMLVSASETYEPRLGRKKLPARITMLDGKHVRLLGHVAYPMFVEQPRELLSMLNQWDGCCIGVPPTPYDAVEVHLKEVVTKEDRLATYGVVEGKFEVKPYLAGDWLVGLYVMENAALTAKEYGGFGS